jgi:hypothetical protein
MGSFYRLQIRCNSQNNEKLESILGKSNDEPAVGWGLKIEEDSPKFTQALNLYVELIDANIKELRKYDISADDITIWYMYEYEQQCNMEFWPDITKRIGELGIVLCISCWEK